MDRLIHYRLYRIIELIGFIKINRLIDYFMLLKNNRIKEKNDDRAALAVMFWSNVNTVSLILYRKGRGAVVST